MVHYFSFLLLFSAIVYHLYISFMLKINSKIEMNSLTEWLFPSFQNRLEWLYFCNGGVNVCFHFLNTTLLCTESLPAFFQFSWLVLKYCFSLQTLYLLDLERDYLCQQLFFSFPFLGCRYDGSKWNDTFNVGSLQNA